MDFTLMLPSASAGLKRRCICVGEVKRAAVLVDRSASPIDLFAAWQDPQHLLHARAYAVISQLFTYMQFWKVGVHRRCSGRGAAAASTLARKWALH